jgi:Zn-dependent protease
MYDDPNAVYEADYRVTGEGEVVRAPSRRQHWLKRYLGPVGAGILFLATKLKFLLVALKGVKFFTTGITALVSIGAYALWFPWQFAVGLVALIFIHEMGHVVVLQRYGVKATAPIFIPFLGALVGMKQLPKNAVVEAYVGLGGPVIGSLGAMAVYGIYLLTDHPIFLALAYIGILLNLFNLLPVLPLDGGRAVGAISRWLWVVGVAGLVALMILRPSPIIFIILLFGAPELFRAIRSRGESDYYTVPFRERLTIGTIYFGLMFVLGFMLYELEPLMHALRPT